jgi:hypothetical protein
MPMLVRTSRWPLKHERRPHGVDDFLAQQVISVAVDSCSNTITNSSPASRATVSVVRTAPVRRRANSISTWSPAGWPSVSLMVLK